MQNLKITLYDVFGYLFPGLVFLSGLAIAFWGLFTPATPARFVGLPVELWAAILVLAYIAGHFLQSFYPTILKSSSFELATPKIVDTLDPFLVEAAKAKIKQIASIDVPEKDKKALVGLCDEFILQRGVSTNQEIYQYREGFYRGMSASCLLLVLALCVRLVRPPTFIALPSGTYPATPGMFIFVIVVFLAAAGLFHLRYVHFRELKVIAALHGFLALNPEGRKPTAASV